MGRERGAAPDSEPRQQPVALLAHRDADLRATMCMLLEEAGYAVRLAADPDVALGTVRELAEPAVVLFEVEPGGEAGAGFLELALLRAAEREAGHAAPRLAFVALTTWTERLPRTLKRLLRKLDVPLVAEPFELDDLLHVIATASGKCRPTEQGSAGEPTAVVAATPATPRVPKPRARRTRT